MRRSSPEDTAPRAAFGPAWSGSRVQGTATSPPSATGQPEGSTWWFRSCNRPTTIGGVIRATLYTDAACPWAYSANPALRVLEWRYGEQLSWRLVMIGLREDASTLIARGYDPRRAVLGQRVPEWAHLGSNMPAYCTFPPVQGARRGHPSPASVRVIHHLARIGRRDEPPGIPRDLEDHERNDQTDDRIADRRAEGDEDRAHNDTE